MEKFFESGPLPDWKELRRMIGAEMPWKLAEQWERSNEESWLNSFVKEWLSRAGQTEESAAPEKTAQTVSHTSVKDGKRLSVQVKLPKGADMRNVRLYATSERLKVTGLPGGRVHSIKLPCLVFPRSGKVEQQGSRLQVRFQRKPPEKSEVELFIRP